MTVAATLLVQAIVLGVVAIAMTGIAADTRYGATHDATRAFAWLAFLVGLASGLVSIWMGVTA